MPNGKGQLDCCYCVHFESKYEGSDAMYDDGFCEFHKAEIPSLLPEWIHRICIDFEANNSFEKYLQYNSLEQRFEWFGKELEENALYGFQNYEDIKKLKDL